MPRIRIDCDEMYPLYQIEKSEPAPAEWGVEVSEEFLAEYRTAMLSFDAVQAKLKVLFKEMT